MRACSAGWSLRLPVMASRFSLAFVSQSVCARASHSNSLASFSPGTSFEPIWVCWKPASCWLWTQRCNLYVTGEPAFQVDCRLLEKGAGALGYKSAALFVTEVHAVKIAQHLASVQLPNDGTADNLWPAWFISGADVGVVKTTGRVLHRLLRA